LSWFYFPIESNTYTTIESRKKIDSQAIIMVKKTIFFLNSMMVVVVVLVGGENAPFCVPEYRNLSQTVPMLLILTEDAGFFC
jgi:amino acid transporter